MSEKSTVIQVRLSEKLKQDLDDICKTVGNKQPSVQVRELIEQFVLDHYEYLKDRLVVHIYRPEGYDFGAWRVAMVLRNPEESCWSGSQIPFRLPKYPNRRLSSDKGYEALVGVPDEKDFVNYEMGGVFVHGKWFGHLYLNGCSEEDNPTPIEQIRDELHQSVTELFDKFAGASKRNLTSIDQA